MTTSEARELVCKIERLIHDDEMAHALEDDLREKILIEIASGIAHEQAVELAKIALATSELDFCRWCA